MFEDSDIRCVYNLWHKMVASENLYKDWCSVVTRDLKAVFRVSTLPIYHVSHKSILWRGISEIIWVSCKVKGCINGNLIRQTTFAVDFSWNYNFNVIFFRKVLNSFVDEWIQWHNLHIMRSFKWKYLLKKSCDCVIFMQFEKCLNQFSCVR